MPRSFLVKKNTEKKSSLGKTENQDVKVLGCTGQSTNNVFSTDKRLVQTPQNTGIQYWNGLGPKRVYPAEVTSIATSINSIQNTAKSTMKFERANKPTDDRSSGEEDLMSHGASIPTERDVHRCHQCNKCYTTMLGLAKHQQYHCNPHQKKTFTCKYCDKIYVSLGALKMHIRTHTLPCKCTICGKAFSRPWLLQGHIRTHTGEKPYKCSICKRAFADRSNLRAHMQTHAEVKKYSCSRCARSFSRMSLLVKHEDTGCLLNNHN